jgi:putative oxidoreductase
MAVWILLEWIGRVFFVLFFIVSGINHLTNVKAMAGYAQSKHVPAPTAAVIASGLLILVSGILILVRWHPTWGAAGLVVFLLSAAFLFHSYWTETDAMAQANQRAQFWKNVTLAAAAVLYAVAHHRGAL